MKKKIALLGLLAVCVCAAWLFAAPRIRVDLAARGHDPSGMKLNDVALMHKSHASLPNGIQTGLIHLQDGGRVKYWFISKHVQPGKGLTRFDFKDGQIAYLSGTFCCEVWVSDDAAKNKESLLAYIARVDGSMP